MQPASEEAHAGISELTRQLAAYLSAEDIAQVEAAYAVAQAAHAGQYRRSGLPYISHPVAVATLLAGWHLDAQTLAAALLHDVVEDTATTTQDLGQRFGQAVAELVDGVSKLDKVEFQSREEAQAENFRKMLLAMARDVRVILIKLADRLHNMRTMAAMPPDKRVRIATETLEIYAPIANRLGLNDLYRELEELCFRYLHPHRYDVLSRAIKNARGSRRQIVERVEAAIGRHLREGGIEAAVSGREKHLYSIYKKMLGKNLAFSEVYDIYGFRVVVRDVTTCYVTLGALHGLYKPIPGKFKDYIAIPKANGYQSLHTTLFGPFGTPVEIQIRTQEMHRIAESGVASHWLYKAPGTALSEVQQKTHQWLQGLVEIQNESGDSLEFLEHIKVDLFPDEVYVFTPKGRIMALPRGATAVDFAYAVHTDVGHHCVAVKINHELAPLRTTLANGDHVEIMTDEKARPSPAWINFVATGKARSHIRHFLKTMHFKESAALGERLLNQALHGLGVDPAAIEMASWTRMLREAGLKTRQEVLADIGLGKRLNIVVARQLTALTETPQAADRAFGHITIRGTEGMAIQLASCCQPIPGDPILGVVKKGQGLVVHTRDCQSLAGVLDQPGRWVEADWDPALKRQYPVRIRVVVANQRGVLAKAAAVIADAGANISNVAMEDEDGGSYTTLYFTLQVEHRIHLARVIRGLRTIAEVVRIARARVRSRHT